MDKASKSITFFDYPTVKKVTSNGNIKINTNNDSLMQAIRIWLATQFGEKVRSRSGGVLMPWIGKTLDEDNASAMESVLRYNLENVFQPKITLVECSVTPNIEKQRWEIYIVGYNKVLSLGVNDLIYVANN